MAGAPTPDPFSARQLQALSRIVSQRVAESVRLGRSEYPKNLRLARTVEHLGMYPDDGDTFWIRFVDCGFSPLEAGDSTMSCQERTAEGNTDGADDVLAREINGKYIPEGSYVSALWQRGLAGDPAQYGEWWIRWPTGPEPEVCPCELIAADHCAVTASLWLISVTGLANDTCSDCDTWNGNFVLCYVSGDKWESPAYDGTECGHTAGDPLWRLERKGAIGSEYYELLAVGIGFRWTKTSATWSCLANNTLTLTYPLPVPSPCGGLPASIVAVPCITQACALCAGGTPNVLSLTLAGVLDDICSCVPLNGTFALRLLPYPYQCIWSTVGTLGCDPVGRNGGYQIRVTLKAALDGHTIFHVWINIGVSALFANRTMVWEYEYDFGAPGAIDCLGTYVPTYTTGFGWFDGRDTCQFSSPPSVQIN